MREPGLSWDRSLGLRRKLTSGDRYIVTTVASLMSATKMFCWRKRVRPATPARRAFLADSATRPGSSSIPTPPAPRPPPGDPQYPDPARGRRAHVRHFDAGHARAARGEAQPEAGAQREKPSDAAHEGHPTPSEGLTRPAPRPTPTPP